MLKECPECHHPLHQGQHKFADGFFEIWYCKKCGFRKEMPISELNLGFVNRNKF